MKVFISHSRRDETLAQKVRDALKKAGLDVWDDAEILPGDNWAVKVSEALNESNAMVVLLTPDSMKSRSVQREIEFALGEKRFNKRLVPVIIGSTQDEQIDAMPWILKRMSPIHLEASNANEEQFNKIASALLDKSD